MSKKGRGVSEFCPKDKFVRLKAVYVRGRRAEGQPWESAGKICPVCGYSKIDLEKVSKCIIG